MLKFVRYIGRYVAYTEYKICLTLGLYHSPNPIETKKISYSFLKNRESLNLVMWHELYASELDQQFLEWFLNTCSKRYGIDAYKVRLNDRLVEDLGFLIDSWSDADIDFIDDFAEKWNVGVSDLNNAITFGEYLNFFWKKIENKLDIQ